eukprot:scaffold911_cov162-Ochromonas_danica.AAC.1
MGRTGDGKSSLGNLIFRLLGGDPNRTPFSEGSSTHSHTRESQSVVVNNVKITDHPGLVDSNGASQDEENIALIVKNLKEDKLVHGFLLVINEEAPRIDWAMQNALKLIVDTFGRGILSVTGVVFTHSYKVSDTKAQEFMAGLRPMITDLTGEDVSTMRFWQVDSHPEERFAHNPAKLSKFVARNQRTVEGIRDWASAKSPFDASKAFPSLYEVTRRFLARKKALEEMKKLKEEADERLRLTTWAEEEYSSTVALLAIPCTEGNQNSNKPHKRCNQH